MTKRHPRIKSEPVHASMLQERVALLVKQFGGLRHAARAIGIDHVYLWRLMRGVKDNPSDDVLRKLRLRRIVEIRFEHDDAL